MNIQYIPLDLDILDDAKMIRVVRKYGMQGFGIYIRIITLLWKKEDDGFRWGLEEEDMEDLHEALRDRGVDRDVMEDIILHHGLFEKDITEGLPGYFYSKSILRRREKMQSKKEMLSNAGKKGMKSRWENRDIITDNIKEDISTLKGSNKVVITNKEKKSKVKEIKLNISFDEIWNLYDYKTGTKEKLRKKWESLTDIEREKIKIHVPLYVKSTPDKQFRKHFQPYLNNCGWEDEILKAVKPKSKTNSVDVLTPILREIRRVGSYGKPEFKEYEKDAQQVARQLGWGNCCTMSEFDLKHNINNSISITQ